MVLLCLQKNDLSSAACGGHNVLKLLPPCVKGGGTAGDGGIVRAFDLAGGYWSEGPPAALRSKVGGDDLYLFLGVRGAGHPPVCFLFLFHEKEKSFGYFSTSKSNELLVRAK